MTAGEAGLAREGTQGSDSALVRNPNCPVHGVEVGWGVLLGGPGGPGVWSALLLKVPDAWQPRTVSWLLGFILWGAGTSGRESSLPKFHCKCLINMTLGGEMPASPSTAPARAGAPCCHQDVCPEANVHLLPPQPGGGRGWVTRGEWVVGGCTPFH